MNIQGVLNTCVIVSAAYNYTFAFYIVYGTNTLRRKNTIIAVIRTFLITCAKNVLENVLSKIGTTLVHIPKHHQSTVGLDLAGRTGDTAVTKGGKVCAYFIERKWKGHATMLTVYSYFFFSNLDCGLYFHVNLDLLTQCGYKIKFKWPLASCYLISLFMKRKPKELVWVVTGCYLLCFTQE